MVDFEFSHKKDTYKIIEKLLNKSWSCVNKLLKLILFLGNFYGTKISVNVVNLMVIFAT